MPDPTEPDERRRPPSEDDEDDEWTSAVWRPSSPPPEDEATTGQAYVESHLEEIWRGDQSSERPVEDGEETAEAEAGSEPPSTAEPPRTEPSPEVETSVPEEISWAPPAAAWEEGELGIWGEEAPESGPDAAVAPASDPFAEGTGWEHTGRQFTEDHLAQIWGTESLGAGDGHPAPRHLVARALAGLLGVAVVAAGVTSAFAFARRVERPAAIEPPSPTPSSSPGPVVLAPEQLSARADAFVVLLSWVQPPGGDRVDAYDVFRDGALVQSVDAPTRAYTDTSVEPGTTYAYGVAARIADRASLRAVVQVETPVPSLASARVEGLFDVTFTLMSQSGFASHQGSFHRGWQFAPRCGTGACDVRWSDIDETNLSATLNRKGGTYRGSDSGDFNAVCGASSITSDLTIEFHVIQAGPVDGEWRATRIRGTVDEFEAAQLGCLSSSARLKITGSLLG